MIRPVAWKRLASRGADWESGANPAATSTAGDTNPLGATTSRTNTEQRRFYPLSPVITVE